MARAKTGCRCTRLRTAVSCRPACGDDRRDL